MLITNVWGYDFYGDDRTLDTHIKLLRRSLGPYSKFIVTLRGWGIVLKASERLLRTRRPLGIWGQILCGFGILILVVAALLWLFQIVLLDPFYRAVKTTEVKATAETVQHALRPAT